MASYRKDTAQPREMTGSGYRVNSPPTSPIRQAYIAHYDSSDSTGANESSALLKEDDDSGQSRNSVCIYYDDTVV